MIEKFFPDLMVDKVQDINMEALKRSNIKGLIFDIDNTLVPSHVEEADENVVKWIEKLKSEGFKTCIVSNNTEKRVIKFNERLKIFAVHKALKPGHKGLLKAARLMNVKPVETAVIGDQIFTDVYGGNRLGMFTVLVKPLDKREFFFIKVKRLAEALVLAQYRRKSEIGLKKRLHWKKKSAANKLKIKLKNKTKV